MRVTIGNTVVTPLAVSANQILALAAALPDGVRDVSIVDPSTGISTTMTAALTLGAGPNDAIRLAQGGNGPTPVGMAAARSNSRHGVLFGWHHVRERRDRPVERQKWSRFYRV
jgi:hypothetical protein